MTEYDYICAQNYIEQVYNARMMSHIRHNVPIHYLVRCGRDYPKRVFGQLRPWDTTREGRLVWDRRFLVFYDWVKAGVIERPI